MKCLSIRQPWPTLIMMACKTVENRSWPAPPALIGERIAIHASAGSVAVRSWNEIEGASGIDLPPLDSLPRGVILGTVRVTGCERFWDLPEELINDPFAEPGGYCWLLAEPQWLGLPIACKGALRLWDVPAGLRLD